MSHPGPEGVSAPRTHEVGYGRRLPTTPRAADVLSHADPRVPAASTGPLTLGLPGVTPTPALCSAALLTAKVGPAPRLPLPEASSARPLLSSLLSCSSSHFVGVCFPEMPRLWVLHVLSLSSQAWAPARRPPATGGSRGSSCSFRLISHSLPRSRRPSPPTAAAARQRVRGPRGPWGHGPASSSAVPSAAPSLKL